MPAPRLLEQLPRRSCAGTPIADVDSLAGEIGDGRDAGTLAREDRHHLRVQGEHGAQAQNGPAGPFPDPGIGRALDIRLQDREIELTGLHRVHTAHGRLDRAANAGPVELLIGEAADRGADRIVDVPGGSRAERNEGHRGGMLRAEGRPGHAGRRGNARG